MLKILKSRLTLVLVLLAAASLACNFPAKSTELPPTAQPLSTQELQNLEEQLQATLVNANPSEEVTLTITQDQLNGVITSQIDNISGMSISDPSVILTDGHAEFYGKVSQSGLSVNLKVVFEPKVDENGQPTLEVTSISLGSFPVPDTLKNQINEMTDQAFRDYVNSASGTFQVKSIDIHDGLMTITGERQ